MTTPAAASPPTSSRINALDIMRGYLILVISSVHLAYYPSLLGAFDGRGQLWVSEAEGFFFISGLLIGLIRRRDIERSGLKTATSKVLKRGFRLYSAAVVLTVLYQLWGRLMSNIDPQAVKGGLDATSSIPVLVRNILDLTYSYGWSDFLIYYAGFLFITPLVLWLLKWRLWPVVLATTLGVWYWRWTGGYGPYNAFLQWQVYFFLGAVIGYYWHELSDKFSSLAPKFQSSLRWGVVALAVLSTIVSAVVVFGPPHSNSVWLSWIGHINDNRLYGLLLVDGRIGLLRPLVLMITFFGAFTLVRRYEDAIIRRLGWLLLPAGRNSLYVYIVASLALYTIPFFTMRGGFVLNSLLELIIVTLVWLGVRYRILFNIIPR